MEIRTISPKVATILLENNTLNRTINDKRVAFYARQMKAGKWKLNGETIIISKTGKLLEGQHRLWACLSAGVPFTTYVVDDVEEDVFDTIDTGAGRNNSDLLHILGYTQTNKLASAVRWFRGYNAGTIASARSGSGKVASFELEETLNAHPQLAEICGTLANSTSLNGLVPVGLTAALAYIFSVIDSQKANEWLKGLMTGENLETGSAVLALRTRLITYNASKSTKKSGAHEYYSFMVNSWNAFLNDETLTTVRGSMTLADGTRVYPKILGKKKEKKIA